MNNLTYYLDQPGGKFTVTAETIPEPAAGEIRLRTVKTSICQSDVVIQRQGLPRIREWPTILLHEACCVVDEIGDPVAWAVQSVDLIASRALTQHVARRARSAPVGRRPLGDQRAQAPVNSRGLSVVA